MRGLRKDIERIVDQLTSTEHGCTARYTNNGYWRVTAPNGVSISMASTPSNPQTVKKIYGDIRRHLGIDLKRR